MKCTAPVILAMAEKVSQVVVAFELDGLRFESNNTKLTVVPNPRFNKFEHVYVLQGKSLILQVIISGRQYVIIY